MPTSPSASTTTTAASPTDPFGDERLTAMGLLVETYAGLVAVMEPDIEAHDLGWSEFDVLLRLARSPDGQLRMTDLATQAALSASGLTRLVDRLVRHDLVTRTACETDRRGSYATLTPAGRARIEGAVGSHLELIDEWFTGPLEPAELDAFVATLRKLRDRVRPGSVAGAAHA